MILANPDLEARPVVHEHPTGVVDDAFLSRCDDEAEAFAMEVRAGVIATPAPPAEWMFDWLYAAPASNLERQRDEALG